MASPLDREHYEGNVIDMIKELRARVEALERTDLSGVAGPQGATGATGPTGPTGSPGPGAPTPLTQGDVLVVDGTPEITTLPIGNAHEILKVNAGGTDPGWEAFDWDEMSGVGGADMVHDHSAAAEGGATLNPTLVDLNGNADAIVLDADGDTSISAPTDDEIDVEVGGADIAKWKAGGLYGIAGVDVYPNANEAGLQERLDRFVAWDEHWDVSSLPAGWSWASDGAGDFMTGAPGSIDYSVNSLIVFGDSSSEKCFLYRSLVGSWKGTTFAGLLTHTNGLSSSEVGIRIDDSSDPVNNYVELFLDYVSGSGTRIVIEYNDGGGETQNVLFTNQPPALWVGLRLNPVDDGGNWKCYIQVGTDYDFNYVTTAGSGKTWTPNRVGVYLKSTTSGTRKCALDACAGDLVSW